jgi:hypothetical protein
MSIKITLFLLLVSSSLFGFAQAGKIVGWLNLQDFENKKIVIEKTFVVLTSRSITDSAKIANDLSFSFERLPSDTFNISITPHPYPPFSGSYTIHLAAGETKNINIPYSSTCPYDKSKDGICPICKKNDEVIPIRYGLLADKIDKNKKPNKRKYKPGGCMIMDCQPNWFCERDQKDF